MENDILQLLAGALCFGLGWFICDYRNSLIIKQLERKLNWYKTHRTIDPGFYHD